MGEGKGVSSIHLSRSAPSPPVLSNLHPFTSDRRRPLGLTLHRPTDESSVSGHHQRPLLPSLLDDLLRSLLHAVDLLGWRKAVKLEAESKAVHGDVGRGDGLEVVGESCSAEPRRREGSGSSKESGE